MTNKLTMIEIFSGIGAQERSLRQLQIPYEVVATMDVDKDAILSYAASRCDFEKELKTYQFPTKEEMIEELQSKNVGYDFIKSKHSITMKTNIDKVKQYYLAHKLSHNLGDVSLLDKLPYVDIICHTSPCQDYSVAGKGAGGDEGSGTRSSLMYESLRLIETSKPKYVLWENVAAVLSAKHKHNFIKYLERLSELGYENMFDLLNAKNYGLPQNRLRIFCVSRKIDNLENTDVTDVSYHSENKQVQNIMNEIRGNENIRLWKSFKFPDKIPLTTRLKDILEKNVDERYYIDNDRVNSILYSDVFKEKLLKKIQTDTDVPIRLTNIYDERFGTGYAGNVWDTNGISPTLQTAQGGNRQPLVVEIDPFIVASRGRNPENPSDRTSGIHTEQTLEPNFNGTTNCITSVQKDNWVCEPLVFDDYNSRLADDSSIINTLTTNCGASAPRNGVKIIEPVICEERRDEGIRLFADESCGTLRTIDACGDKRVIEFEIDTIKVKNQATEFADFTDIAGTLLARDYKGFGNQEMTAVMETYDNTMNIKMRIRKLTPKESWRLMGFSDTDHDKVSKYVSASSLYKQAGNSIVTNCLISIFSALFLEDYSTSYADKLVDYNS